MNATFVPARITLSRFANRVVAYLSSSYALALVVLADVCHRAISFSAGPAPPTLDAALYWRLAFRMVSGDWLLSDPPVAYPMPLYPAYLAGCILGFGKNALMAAMVGQHVIGIATALACWLAVKTVSGSRTAALIAYGLSALALGRVQFANHSLTESLATFFVAIHCLALSRYCRRQSGPAAAFAGATLAAAGLVRGTTVLFWPVELLCLIAIPHGGLRSHRSRLGIAGAFAAGFVAISGLNWGREAVLFRTPAANAGQGILWLSTFREGARLPLPDTPQAEAIADEKEEWRNEFTAAERLAKSGLDPIQVQVAMRSIAVDAIRNAPLAYIQAYARNWLAFWTNVVEAIPWYRRTAGEEAYLGLRPWLFPAFIEPFEPILRFVYRYSPWFSGFAALAALGGAALLTAAARTRLLGVILLLLMLYWASVIAFAWPLFRYRAPLHPVMVLAFAAAAHHAAAAVRGALGQREGEPT